MWKPKKWIMKEAKALSDDDIRQMTTEELSDLAQYYYTMFKKREQEAARRQVLPYGIRKMYKDWEAAKTEIVHTGFGDVSLADLLGYNLETPVTRKRGDYVELSETFLRLNRPRNALMSYVYRMRDFFTWKSGTVAGWLRIARKQDLNLFGADENGNPKYQMNENERIRFWELYDELKARGNVEVYADGKFTEDFISNWIDIAKSGELYREDFVKITKRMEKKLGDNIAFPEYPAGDLGNLSAPAYAGDDIWVNDVWGRNGYDA